MRPLLQTCGRGGSGGGAYRRQVPTAAPAAPSFGRATGTVRHRASAADAALADAEDAEADDAENAPIPPAWAAAARRAHVAVVLVEPQICENIGAAARAMRNFGIRPGEPPNLRLVRPRDGFPPPQLSFDVACGGADLVAAAGGYDSLQEALADRQVVYAATARARRQAPRALTSRQLARDFARRCAAVEEAAAAAAAPSEASLSSSPPGDTPQPARVALVFGRESSGLTNDEVGRAHAVVEVDASSDYPVLNLGQAVSAVCYDLWRVRRPLAVGVAAMAGGGGEEGESSSSGSGGSGSSSSNNPAAEARQVDALLARLYASLERGGFFTERSKRPSVERSLAGLLRRVDGLGERDLALLHGVLTALTAAAGQKQEQEQREL